MCVLAATGIVIWWPRRGSWGAAFKVTGKGSTLMVLRELHGAAGIWGLVVFFIISFTGVVISFPPAGAQRPGGGSDGGPRTPVEIKADAAVAQAQAAVPSTALKSVAFPKGPGDTYRVSLSRLGDDRSVPPIVVTVAADAAQVVSVRDSAADARAWARPVHAGGAMGWVWWILTLLSGVLPVLFAVSGIWMWLIKRRNKARVAVRR
jgi:uncharacterized iron-regulated membrane protein